MQYFPVFLDLAAAPVVAVGGGEEIAQKLRLLLKTPAKVRIVAPNVTGEIEALARLGRVTWLKRTFRDADLDDACLVYAASGDAGLDARVSRLARARRLPVNVVDAPQLCSFYTPAIVDRDPVVIAIGTEGTAPVLARGLKARLEALLPPGLGTLARRAAALRERVAAALAPGAPRRRFWHEFFFGRTAERYFGGDSAGFTAAVERSLTEAHANAETAIAPVSLVGAGPGDPDLLTLKAQRRLQEADVIVYDRLVGAGVLEYARRDAERICVGKTPGRPSATQDEINALLIAHAQAGRRVVRLKGGDPYIFGRGAEEQAALEARDIPVEVVPGITAAAACAASVRLPLTTRGENRAFTLLTAMTGDGAAEHDWQRLARPGETFAVYMGVGAAGHLQDRLAAAGIDPATPVVIVENGTRPNERCVSTTIAHLRATVRREAVKGPAIIYVGLRWPAARSSGETAGAAQRVIPFPQPASAAGEPRREVAI